MPLILRVLSCRGAAPLAPVAATFAQEGGTIGRAPGNDLMLDDPDKTISRTHAWIAYRDARFYFADAGSNPSLINGMALGIGRQAVLSSGDQIMIGDYLLEALLTDEVPAGATPALPMLDVFSLPPAAPAPVLPLAELPPPPRPLAPDELLLGREDCAPFRMLGISGQASRPGAALADPLSTADILSASAGRDNAAPVDDPLGLNLFGGGAGACRAGFAHETRQRQEGDFQGSASDHTSPESEALSRYSGASGPAAAIPDGYDALSDQLSRSVALRRSASIGAATQSREAGWDSADITVPAKVRAGQTGFDASARAEVHAGGFSANDGSRKRNFARKNKRVTVYSDADMESGIFATPQAASESVPTSESERGTETSDLFADGGEPSRSLPGLPSPSMLHLPESDPETGDDATLQALLRGLGLPNLVTVRSGAELAYLTGAMLREATDGTMAMLMARSLTKHENRIDTTAIGSTSNNPLKFFPDAGAALAEMLGSTSTGYLQPVHAFVNAFDDLKAHELAMLAGMRAALSGVLARFDPASFDQHPEPTGVLDKVMAAHRKAALWDRLVTLHAQILCEAEDDFQRLFGENFAIAYREQAKQHRADGPANASSSSTKQSYK